MCQQAQVYCTPGRAKKVTASMLLVGFTASTVAHTVNWVVRYGTILYTVVLSIYFVLFFIIVPVSVLVINMIVVREVRRASNNAAVNLGLQQHQQSTSSNSVVPTVTLVRHHFAHIRPALRYLVRHHTHGLVDDAIRWLQSRDRADLG